MKFSAGVLSAIATLSVASAAYAVDLDFTSIPPNQNQSPCAGAPNGASCWATTTADGITVTITPGPSGTSLYWDDDDGFGVSGPSYEDDEVEGNETLTVKFTDAQGNAVNVVLDSFNVSDLFVELDDEGKRSYAEIGKYKVDGAAVVSFTPTNGVADHSNVNGTGTVYVGASTSTLILTAPGKIVEQYYQYVWGRPKLKESHQDHEFSLAGLSFQVVSVPELSAGGAAPALLLLSGMGLVLGGRRRRPGSTASA